MGSNCSCLKQVLKEDKVSYDYQNMIRRKHQSASDQFTLEIERQYQQELQSHLVLKPQNPKSHTPHHPNKHFQKNNQTSQQEAVFDKALDIQISKIQNQPFKTDQDISIHISYQCQIHLQCISRAYLDRKNFKLKKKQPQIINFPYPVQVNPPTKMSHISSSLPSTQVFSKLDQVFGKLKLPLLNDGVQTIWRPAVQFSNGTVYQGHWSRDKPYGVGFQVEPNGNFFHGYFINGQKDFYGRFLMSDGSAYQGYLKDGLYFGQGLFRNRFGTIFSCKFKKGLADGEGVEKQEDGTVYEGNFVRGKREGLGKLLMKDGSVYMGEFTDGYFQGKGNFVWPNKRKYEGNWKGGKMNGEGKLILPDKAQYTGSFENDKKHGYGEFIWPDGRKYTGSWAYDQFDGRGELVTVVTGRSIARQGIWSKGKRLSWVN